MTETKPVPTLQGRPTDSDFLTSLLNMGMQFRYGVDEPTHQAQIYGKRDFDVPAGITDPQRERYVSAFDAGRKWGPGMERLVPFMNSSRQYIAKIPGNPFAVGDETGMNEMVVQGSKAGVARGWEERGGTGQPQNLIDLLRSAIMGSQGD